MAGITIKRNKDKEVLENVYDDLCMALGTYESDDDANEFYLNVCNITEELSNYLN